MKEMDTPYTRLDAIVSKYADDFELDDGEACYLPNDFERSLISHAIHGLICREDFMETLLQARMLTRAARSEEGQHLCCGAGLDHPHYGLCVNAKRESP